LVGKGDVAVVDSQAHASVLSVRPMLTANGAEVRSVPHIDIEEIERRIGEAGDRQVWYLTDGVFSMHGDSVPAEEIRALLDQYPNFHVYCDDAHGFGWDGLRGMGNFLKRSGWHDRLVISAGMAKSFGTIGGIVATQNADLLKVIRLAGSPLVFGGPIPPPMLGASIAAADIHLSDDHPRLQGELNRRISLVNEFSEEIGLPLAVREHNPIWYLEIGSFGNTFAAAESMRKAGFYVNPAVFPVVARGHGGIRFTVTNYHSIPQIEEMLVCLNQIRLEMFGETDIAVDMTEADAMGGSTSPESQEPKAQ
ncbi:MAG: aminotransferase class I/II-fold pyridoxal phosphate-dependent enzyme, partial [Acidimicrobiia bacterium]|nr:aminotransferase class I/II-fold pyridoxal phosphate-dependent enzyme [Acidimicrobiia bacterium]